MCLATAVSLHGKHTSFLQWRRQTRTTSSLVLGGKDPDTLLCCCDAWHCCWSSLGSHRQLRLTEEVPDVTAMSLGHFRIQLQYSKEPQNQSILFVNKHGMQTVTLPKSLPAQAVQLTYASCMGQKFASARCKTRLTHGDVPSCVSPCPTPGQVSKMFFSSHAVHPQSCVHGCRNSWPNIATVDTVLPALWLAS